MSTSDKRRAGPGSGAPSHVIRTTPSNAANRDSSHHRGGSSIIAAPPRAALGSGAGASPPQPGGDADSSREGSIKERDRDRDNGPASGSSASVAATQLVKEKDLRIAALERELSVAEAEFRRELDKLSQNESETAAFWQAKHSSLNQQFLRADTELRLLRNEVEIREAERDELRAGWETARRDAGRWEDEARALRGQVRGLKEWVSTSTRTGGQTSDEVFGEGMARLGNGLQNWVIVNFRRAKLGKYCPFSQL
jgi:activating signal cointegrator complex subunit 1